MNDPAMTEMAERRQAVRYPLAWPVILEDGTGTTWDISATGVCFRTDRELERGILLRFALVLPESPDNTRYLVCQGEVVRVERCGKGFGIAVRFERIQFIPFRDDF